VSSIGLNIISPRVDEIRVFVEFSEMGLVDLIDKKTQEKVKMSIEGNDEDIIPYSNMEIANFIRSVTGIATEIQTLCLPI